MKQLFTSFLLIAAAHVCNAQTITWGTPITVSSGTTSNLHPRIALNRSGNPMVLWGKSDTRAYFARWSGSAFSTPIVLNNSFTVFAQSWAGPDIATYGDTIYATLKRNPETSDTNYSFLVHSYDGGSTFSMPMRIDNIDTSLSRFPIVTTTSTGNPLVAFMKFNSMFNDAKYVVSKSTDYGNTFSADALASGTAGDVCDCCPATIVSSGSKAIMLFRNNLSNIRDIWAGVSSDGGSTFSGTMSVDNTNWMITSCPASGPDGFVIGDSIYTVFRSSGTGTAKVYLSKSSISGMVSTSTTAITGSASGITAQDYPRIANAGNAATVVWKQTSGGMNMICRAFTNDIMHGFTTFDTLAMGSGLMNADVAMTPGAIHIAYEDDNTGKLQYVKGTYTVPSTSVATVVTKERIDLYPNPANESFSVNLNKINTISYSYLTDVTGKRVDLKASIKNDKATFSLTGIAKGNYYFVLGDETGKVYYSKLVVQ